MSTKSTKNSKTTQTSPSKDFRAVFGDRAFEHYPLAEFSSVKLGGVADYLVIATTADELMKAADIATHHELPFVVVSGGTGILISDVGYPGLVIINRTSNVIFDQATSQAVVDSGVHNDQLLNQAVSRGLGGIEFLAAIPGTIGGAIATNATWQDRPIKRSLKEIVMYVPGKESGKIITLKAEELEGEPYQPLLPKSLAAPPIILTARVRLAQVAQPEIMRRLIQIRRLRHQLITSRALGNVFTRPITNLAVKKSELLRLRSDLVGLHRRDPDILITHSDKATARLMRQLIGAIRVYAKSAGQTLEDRVHFLGYWPDEEVHGGTESS